jgi:hypothetical protein
MVYETETAQIEDLIEAEVSLLSDSINLTEEEEQKD